MTDKTIVAFRLSEGEKKVLKLEAEKNDMTVSDLIRSKTFQDSVLKKTFEGVFFIDSTVTISPLSLDMLLFDTDSLQLYLTMMYCAKAEDGKGLTKLQHHWIEEEGNEENAEKRYIRAVERLTNLGLIKRGKSGFSVLFGESYLRTAYEFVKKDGKDVMIICETDKGDNVLLITHRSVTPAERKEYEEIIETGRVKEPKKTVVLPKMEAS